MSYPEPKSDYHHPTTPDAQFDADEDGSTIVHGRWAVDLCDGGDNVAFTVCCPGIVMAQIAHRVNYMPYNKAVLLFGIEDVLTWLVLLLMLYILTQVHGDFSDSFYNVLYFTFGIALLYAIWHIFTFTSRSRIRRGIRQMYDIPGCKKNDEYVLRKYSSCAIVQMAEHVKSSRPGACDLRPRSVLPAFQSHFPVDHPAPQSTV